jgi:hypothetical protein
VAGGALAIGVLVIGAFAGAYAALVSTIITGPLRAALFALDAAGVALASLVLVGIANNPG